MRTRNGLAEYRRQDMWDNFASHRTNVFYLLKKLDLGAPDSKLKQAGKIIFHGFGGGPGTPTPGPNYQPSGTQKQDIRR